MKTPNN